MKVGLIVLTLRGYSLIHTGEFDIMNNLLQWGVFSSDDPVCNSNDCESEDSFVTALDESSTLTEKSISCDCTKCPDSLDVCCCQHFLKIRQDCHGK